MLRYIYLLFMCGLYHQMATFDSTESSNSIVRAKRYEFATKIMKVVANSHSHDNLIFSPASIQAAMALLYLGADGETAEEINSAVLFGEGDKSTMATSYGSFMKANFNKEHSGASLILANALFVNQDLQIASEFRELAEQNFDAEVTTMNFANPVEAASGINSWVENKTNSKITDLLQADALNSETSALLINAIYFKALWEEQFVVEATYKARFSLDNKSQVEVDMMYNDDTYRYAEVKSLDIKVLELSYRDTDLSMLLLLPNRLDGLKHLENNLGRVDLNNLASTLQFEDVVVSLPKFQIEFEMDLKAQLIKLGVSTMFSENANFSCLLNDNIPQKISEAKHKAYLKVDEYGSEAAAATFLKLIPMSLKLNRKIFKADHPFMFVIRNSDAAFFIGHVVKL